MQTSSLLDRDSMYVTIAGIEAVIRAPEPVLTVLRRTLAHAERPTSARAPTTEIVVTGDEHTWRIEGGTAGSVKVLSATSAIPRVGGAIVSSLVESAARSAGLNLCRAAVVERGGRAIAFVGDDWESGVVLTAHLHARGWHLIGGDYALIDPASLSVYGSRKLLYVTLSHAEELPLSYRRAVEVSPWFSTSHDIAFYAVDPMLVEQAAPWAERGDLRAVLKVDGNVSDAPSLERVAPFTLGQGVSSDELESSGVAVAEVILGSYVSTCDLIERWFASLSA